MPARRISKNLEMLAVVAKGLQGLSQKVVFVGGATIDLYLGPGAPATRATDDVDCVVELGTRIRYHQLEEELRTLGFQHPLDERGPICRWKFLGIKVDVMPTDGALLGFSNRWYRDGVAQARGVTLFDGQEVLAFSPVFLVASKIEAFRDRGHDDYLASPDIEDIVALLDGCPDIEREVERAPHTLRRYLVTETSRLLATAGFLYGLEGNLAPGPGGRERIERCLQIMRRIGNLPIE